MNTKSLLPVFAAGALAFGASGCSGDPFAELRAWQEVKVEVRSADHPAGPGTLVARAESRFPRHPVMLMAATWDKAGEACGEDDYEPVEPPEVLADEAPKRRVYELTFKCTTPPRLPNDEQVTAQVILDGKWPEPLPGVRTAEGQTSYGYPRMRPRGAYIMLLGAQIARADEACGDRPFVIERIESRTQIAEPKGKGRLVQSRAHGVRLQYRCLDATTHAARPTVTSSAP